MTPGLSLLSIGVLIVTSAFFSIAEIALAASRRMKLQQMADAGDGRAQLVLAVQSQPGHYFTAVQVALNAVAILGGIVGESALTPHAAELLSTWISPDLAATIGFIIAFVLVTSLFIIFSDLFPKRLGMADPERVAVLVVRPMLFFVRILKPLVWLYSRATDALFFMLGLSSQRDERVTPADILAMAEAGAQAGALAPQEQQVIANLFELDTRPVSSAMTPRDHIAWFDKNDSDATIRARILAEPYSTYPVCDGSIDHLLGYVDAKDLFQRVLKNEPIGLATSNLLHKALVIPDQLSLAEVLTQFRQVHEDFAILVNEYSLIVGVVTLNDVMSTVMGDLVPPMDEELIVQRNSYSWLIDGITPIQDIQRALHIANFPNSEGYETLAGFLMVMLRRVPRKTDKVSWAGYRFEVMDVDNHRIDQVMVTLESEEKALTDPSS